VPSHRRDGRYYIRKRKIPFIVVRYPNNEEEAKVMVAKIKEFLEGLK